MCREEECDKAYQMFNGRWYAQRQLSCEFCPVTKWKSAICGELVCILQNYALAELHTTHTLTWTHTHIPVYNGHPRWTLGLAGIIIWWQVLLY